MSKYFLAILFVCILIRPLGAEEYVTFNELIDAAGQKEKQTGEVLDSTGSQKEEISGDEERVLLSQLEQCWSIPSGTRIEDSIVELQLVVLPDRTVQSAKIIDQKRYRRDNDFRKIADAARRAIRNPACSPLELPPEKYQEWRNLRLTFDPSKML